MGTTAAATRQGIRRHAALLITLAVWLALGAALLAVTSQRDLHLTLNGLNLWGGDSFFRWITYLGDRRVGWAVGALLCFWRLRSGVAVLVAVITAGVATEILKYQIFGPLPRPVAYFGDPSPLYLVPGFTPKLEYTLPSGHAAIVFALCATLALQTRSRLLQVLLVAVALVSAYSRVYLSEHFFEDIYAGSILGVLCAFLAYALIRPPDLRAPGAETPNTGDAAGP